MEYISNFVVGMFNRGQRIVDKFTKLSKIGLLWNVLQLIFRYLLAQMLKFAF